MNPKNRESPILWLLGCVPLALLLAQVARADANLVIAQGGSVALSAADVRTAVAALPESSRRVIHSSLPALEQLLRSEIAQRTILSDVRAAGFDHDPKTLVQLRELQRDALVRLWIASQANVPTSYPSAADVQAAYDAARAAAPAEYHIAQIFIRAPDGGDPAALNAALRKATDIASRVNADDFAELARAQSEDSQSAPNGGDLGFIPGERMVPEVYKVVSSLAPGQVSGPVKTSQGLHFVKLIAKRPIALPPLSQVRDRIAADLRTRRTQELERAYINRFTAKLGISINEIELAKLQASLD
ncbi:MAG TPA: peptidylprolyl isomerase [Steroidobacteraceae bacterium]|nr:peptidylprolyl isomerase [Steroidobacteraceae bacterium]